MNQRKYLASFASFVLLALGSCVATGSKDMLPPEFTQNGLRVAADGFYTMGIHTVGISGVAKNETDSDFSSCMITFDVLDGTGAKVCDAFASVQGLKAGQEWRFQATFTAMFSTRFRKITPGRVQVVRGR